MTRYVIRRVALALVVVTGVVILTFVIAGVVPGASAAQVARARQYLGLNEPLPVRITRYFGGILTGDWGVSVHTHNPVLSDIGTAAPATIELVIAALIIGAAAGIPLGLAAARWPGSILDHVIRVGSVLGVSMPVFWLALILQLVFAQRLRLLPVAGQYDPNLMFSRPLVTRTQMPVVDSLISGNWAMLGSTLSHLILPALVVATYPAGVVARITRAQLLDTLGETHVQMVRSLGFPERTVVGTFAMKLAWNPVAAILALVFAYSLVNTFLVESIFDWPGLGSYAAAAISTLDTPAIVGVTLFVAIVYVACNLIVDLVRAALDPRIRLR